MDKKETKNLTITISTEIHSKIKEHGYNGNRLINQLLKKFLEKKEK